MQKVLLDKAIELGLSFSEAAFPIDIFPSEMLKIIAEVQKCQGFPIDCIASRMLVAIAVGIGNTHPVQTQTRLVRLCNALCGISRTSWHEQKSLSLAMKPFLDFDYHENKLYKQAYS